MPNGDLPNNGNIWQTTEPVRLENKQVISIIGLLNHQNLPAQVTSLSLSRHICFLPTNFKAQSVDFQLHTSSTCYQSARRTTSACVYSTYCYTICYARLLSKLTPSTGINPPYAEQFGPYSNIVQCDDHIMNVHIKWKCLIPILSTSVKYYLFQA